MIVVGSGYGASIAASRCARSRQKVCVLERGKEWLPGSFPESMSDAGKNIQIDILGKPEIIGKYVILKKYSEFYSIFFKYIWKYTSSICC